MNNMILLCILWFFLYYLFGRLKKCHVCMGSFEYDSHITLLALKFPIHKHEIYCRWLLDTFFFLKGELPRSIKPEKYLSSIMVFAKAKCVPWERLVSSERAKCTGGEEGSGGRRFRRRQWMQSGGRGAKSVPLCNKYRFSFQCGK